MDGTKILFRFHTHNTGGTIASFSSSSYGLKNRPVGTPPTQAGHVFKPFTSLFETEELRGVRSWKRHREFPIHNRRSRDFGAPHRSAQRSCRLNNEARQYSRPSNY